MLVGAVVGTLSWTSRQKPSRLTEDRRPQGPVSIETTAVDSLAFRVRGEWRAKESDPYGEVTVGSGGGWIRSGGREIAFSLESTAVVGRENRGADGEWRTVRFELNAIDLDAMGRITIEKLRQVESLELRLRDALRGIGLVGETASPWLDVTLVANDSVALTTRLDASSPLLLFDEAIVVDVQRAFRAAPEMYELTSTSGGHVMPALNRWVAGEEDVRWVMKKLDDLEGKGKCVAVPATVSALIAQPVLGRRTRIDETDVGDLRRIVRSMVKSGSGPFALSVVTHATTVRKGMSWTCTR